MTHPFYVRNSRLCLIFRYLLLICLFAGAHQANAQRVALKTNAIDWLIMSPNLSVEARISSKLTMQMAFAANPFNISIADISTKNYRVEPELRYWFNRPMARHFVALSATAAAFNLRHADHHFNGDAIGAGVSYGYALVLSNHWNMEFEAGVGVAHIKAFDYHGDERPAQKNYSHFKIVPIRLGLSFSYIFK